MQTFKKLKFYADTEIIFYLASFLGKQTICKNQQKLLKNTYHFLTNHIKFNQIGFGYIVVPSLKCEPNKFTYIFNVFFFTNNFFFFFCCRYFIVVEQYK